MINLSFLYFSIVRVTQFLHSHWSFECRYWLNSYFFPNSSSSSIKSSEDLNFPALEVAHIIPHNKEKSRIEVLPYEDNVIIVYCISISIFLFYNNIYNFIFNNNHFNNIFTINMSLNILFL